MGCCDELDGRPGQRGRLEQDVTGVRGQTCETAAGQLLQAFGHRQGAAGRRPRVRADELPAELQREERIAARCIAYLGQLAAGQLEPDALLEQLVQGSEAQRVEGELGEPVGREGASQLERGGRVRRQPQGRQQTDLLLPESMHGDVDDRRRRRVEPLHVVESDEDRAGFRQRLQRVEQGEPDQERFGRRLARLLELQRHLERAAAWRHEVRRHVADDAGQQLGQAGEGIGRLRLDAAAGQNPGETLPGLLDARLPEGCLPDPGLAGEDERGGAVLDLGQEGADRVQLLLAPDDRSRHRDQASSVAATVAARWAASPARERMPSLR